MRTVAVLLDEPLRQEVAAWAEAEAGWHVSTLEGMPAPELVLAGSVVTGRATVVVSDGPATSELVHRALRDGAVGVVSWPSERERLLEIGAGGTFTRRAGARQARVPRLLVVAGAAGGTGTSTVTLAVAGLLAWSRRRVLVLGGPDLLALAGVGGWRGPGLAEITQLDPRAGAQEVAVLAREVPGVPGLRVLGSEPGRGDGAYPRMPTPGFPGVFAGWPADLVIVDAGGVAGGADLLVARPDRCLEAAGPSPVAVVGTGLLGRAGVRRTLGREPCAWLPQSARVARAGLSGRVPSSLPGSWLRLLRPALAAMLRPPQPGAVAT